MSNEPNRPAEDAPKATPASSGASPATPASPSPASGSAADPAAAPDVPPADAERIAASEAAAASAGEPELSAPASSGLGSDAGTVEADTTAEPGAGAKEGSVTGNEPVTPAGPAGVTGALPTPSAEPVASPADEPASDAPAADASSRPKPEDGKPGGGVGVGKILIGVVVVLLIGVVVIGVRYILSGPANAEAGDCVSLSEEVDNRAEVDVLDCAEDKASFKVGKVLEASDATCPEEGIYTEVAPAGSAGDGSKLCLLPNMVEGACYGSDETGTGFVKTECAGGDTFKVTKVIPDSIDTSACPDGAGMSYPEPPVTYCLQPAEM